MNASNTAPRGAGPAGSSRIEYLDATRALALMLGVLFHASLSFSPVFSGWAVQDVSTSPLIPMFVTVTHSFRMETFFLMAGFLSHLVYHRKGAAEFVRTRAIRIAVPFVAGWFLLRPLLVSGWIMGAESLRGKFHFWSGIEQAFAGLRSLPAGLFTGTHLWFLYYLVIVTALTLVLRGLLALTGSWYGAVANGADKLVAWLAKSHYASLGLAVPTAGALWFMQYWGMDTPDQSLRWNLPVLAVYGGCFALGWMLERQQDAIATFSRLTPARWILAGASMAATFWLSDIQLNPAHDHYASARLGFAVSYAAMMWSLILLTIGIGRKLSQRPRPFVRYLADSSYWLYLVHLPIVVWLQVSVADIALHWSLKLGFVCGVTVALSLLSYDLFVRSTFIGWLLNGTRRNRMLWVVRSSRQLVPDGTGIETLAARPVVKAML